MATVPLICNPIGPLSQATELEWPEYTGFLCEVHEKEDTEAYGFPIYPPGPDGKEDYTKPRIFPGTVGGTPNKALLGRKRKKPSTAPGAPPAEETITWKEYRTRRHQSAGRINWWGVPVREGKPKKWVLSYAGPNTRHFKDGFRYGSDKKHNEIYSQGGIVAVAPGPVTGAALIKIPDAVKLVTPTLADFTFYIVCVCIDEEGREKVYRNLLKPPVWAKDMTDKVRKGMMAEINHDWANPHDGWLLLCDVALSPSEYKRASTPFFFSEDGTKAAAIRLKDFKFVADTSDGIEVTEEIGSKITVTIPPEAAFASYEDKKNDKPYEWKETGDFTDYGTFSFGGGFAQQEKGFKVLGSMTGTQIVAVDYIGNELIECRYRVVSRRGFTKDWVKADPWPPTGGNDWPGGYGSKYTTYMPYANCLLPTPVVDDELMEGMEYPNHPNNHQDQMFYSDKVFNTLEWRVADKLKVAVIELGDIITDKATTTVQLSETMAARMYVRHLDLRAPVIFVHISEEHITYANGVTDEAEAIERESWCKDFSDPKKTTYEHIASGEPYTAEGVGVPPEVPLSQSRSANWDDLATRWAGSDHWEWKAKTYRGVPPDSNDDNSKGEINGKSKYNPENKSLIANSWIGIDQLEDPAFQTEDMGVAVMPSLEVLANMYLYDVELDDGTYTFYTVESTTIDAEKVMGGKWLYPLAII